MNTELFMEDEDIPRFLELLEMANRFTLPTIAIMVFSVRIAKGRPSIVEF